ncbi:MAG: UDP-3-O-(3-hydroxymyristoyl)glucosamine N-acyltransferase [Betaproteobacteria bacterium]
MTLGQLVALLGGTLEGSGDTLVSRVATLDAAGPGELSFLHNVRYRHQLSSTRAAAVIVAPSDAALTTRPRIVAANPYAYMARAAALLSPAVRPAPGVHPGASVPPGASVAADAWVDAGCVVGAGAEIGARAVIGPGCTVGEQAVIGEDSVLHTRVSVYHDCRVGARCVLHAGVVVGADGFGFAEEEGRWVKVPQLGRAVLGDDVELGANTCIDRGTLGDTVVEEGVKMDNLIQVGHNVLVGAHTAIAACAGIAGSTRIGRHCKIGGAAMIHGHITLCDHAVVAAGTMVRRSIEVPGVYDGFFPALPHREWMKNLAHFNRLGEIADSVRRLERNHGAEGADK